MQIDRLIWFAMFLSTVIYGVIAFVTGGHPAAPFASNFNDIFVVIMYVLAAVMFFVGTVLPNVAMSAGPPRVRRIQHDFRLYLFPWAVCILGFLRVFPTSEAS